MSVANKSDSMTITSGTDRSRRPLARAYLKAGESAGFLRNFWNMIIFWSAARIPIQRFGLLIFLEAESSWRCNLLLDITSFQSVSRQRRDPQDPAAASSRIKLFSDWNLIGGLSTELRLAIVVKSRYSVSFGYRQRLLRISPWAPQNQSSRLDLNESSESVDASTSHCNSYPGNERVHRRNKSANGFHEWLLQEPPTVSRRMDVDFNFVVAILH